MLLRPAALNCGGAAALEPAPAHCFAVVDTRPSASTHTRFNKLSAGTAGAMVDGCCILPSGERCERPSYRSPYRYRCMCSKVA